MKHKERRSDFKDKRQIYARYSSYYFSILQAVTMQCILQMYFKHFRICLKTLYCTWTSSSLNKLSGFQLKNNIMILSNVV